MIASSCCAINYRICSIVGAVICCCDCYDMISDGSSEISSSDSSYKEQSSLSERIVVKLD